MAAFDIGILAMPGGHCIYPINRASALLDQTEQPAACFNVCPRKMARASSTDGTSIYDASTSSAAFNLRYLNRAMCSIAGITMRIIDNY